jgi:type I restriction enzyme S subunit
MEAVGEEGSLDRSQARPLGEVIDGYTYLSEGDVTFAKITPCFENGKGAIIRGLREGVGFGTTELTVARPDTSQVTGDYLYRVISSRPFRELGESHMYGAGGQKRVPDDFLRNFELAWPPTSEQATIAAFLDHETARIDDLVEEQQRLIALLKEKRQAVISHAVTKGLDPDVPMKDSGVEWLGDVPAHWDVCQFRHVLIDGSRNGLYKPDADKDPHGVSFIQMGEAFASRVFGSGTKDRVYSTPSEVETWGLKEGDLLFARRSIVLEGSGRCTRIGCITEPHLYESSMIRVRPNPRQVNYSFIHYLLDSSSMRAQLLATTKTVTISGIDSGQLKSLRIVTPPLDEQEKVASLVEKETTKVDRLINEAEKATRFLQERRSALISAAVTGKIDVRGWTPPADSNPVQQKNRMEAV